MASYTIYAGTGDGFITSSSTTYSSARSGTSLSATTTGTNMVCGQLRSGSTRQCRETFLSFDLSSVSGSASSATLSLYEFGQEIGAAFTLEARLSSWTGSGLTTADWVAGASLGGLTLVASLSSGSFIGNNYNAFSSEAALLTEVDAHGSLEILISSSRHRVGNDPASNEYFQFVTADNSGTSQDPKIDITTVDPGNPWNYYAQLQ